MPEKLRRTCSMIVLAACVCAGSAVPAAGQGAKATGPSLSARGFKSALAVELGQSLKMAPVAKALARAFGTVQPAGEGIFVPQAGPRGEAAWVFPDGRVVVATSRELSDRKTCSELALAWKGVARQIAGVVVAVKAADIHDRFRDRSQFYTLKADQFQYLYVKQPRTFTGWVLSWPDGRQSWAQLQQSNVSSMFAVISMDEKALLKGSTKRPTDANLGRVKFGEHALATNRYSHGGWMVIRAFFRKPGGRAQLYDKSNKSVVTHEAYSRPLASLALPAAAAAPKLPKPGGPTAAELGWRSALCVDLGSSLKMDPIAKALQRKFGQVHSAQDDAVYVPRAGAQGQAAWVTPDGRIIVAARNDLATGKVLNGMELVWKAVAREVAGVLSDVTEDGTQHSFLTQSDFYTVGANQFQFLYVKLPASFDGWIVNWPDARQSWASLLESPVSSMFAVMSMDEKQILKGNRKEPVVADLAKVSFGEHSLATTRYQHSGYMIIAAYFATPNGRVLLHDKADRSMVTRASFSRPLTRLVLPPCDAYAKPVK